MYLEYFLKAREYLRGHGLKAEVKMGSPVTEDDLNAMDLETDLPLPAELRHFYLELGDGFHFEPDEAGRTPAYSVRVRYNPITLAKNERGNL